jgi:hypothetical protein
MASSFNEVQRNFFTFFFLILVFKGTESLGRWEIFLHPSSSTRDTPFLMANILLLQYADLLVTLSSHVPSAYHVQMAFDAW